jgi:hypothetical protein
MNEHGDLCGGGIGHDLLRVHRILERPEVGLLLVCANRFTHKIAAAKFRPVRNGQLSETVYNVAPPSAAMEIIRADDSDEALATLGYWSKGLPD